MPFKTRIQQAEPPPMPEPVAAHFEWEGATQADGCWSEFQSMEEIPDAWDDPPTKRTDLFTAAQMAERDAAWQAHLDDLKETHTYFLERSAQRSQRLWQWAHEELSEPLKTRYFNIVANGTADWMEQPIYAQQFNSLKHERDALAAENARITECGHAHIRRAAALESERDKLRAEVEALRADAFESVIQGLAATLPDDGSSITIYVEHWAGSVTATDWDGNEMADHDADTVLDRVRYASRWLDEQQSKLKQGEAESKA